MRNKNTRGAYVVSLTSQVFSFSSTSYGLNLNNSLHALFQSKKALWSPAISKLRCTIFLTILSVFFSFFASQIRRLVATEQRYSEHLLIMNGRTWRTWTRRCTRTPCLLSHFYVTRLWSRFGRRPFSPACPRFSLPYETQILTSRTEMTYHARREFFVPNCNIFSVLSIFKRNKPRQNKIMISLLLLNNFYRAISYRRVQKKKKATNYCIRFGHSLWSANQLPAQGVKDDAPWISTCFKLFSLRARLDTFSTVHDTMRARSTTDQVSWTADPFFEISYTRDENRTSNARDGKTNFECQSETRIGRCTIEKQKAWSLLTKNVVSFSSLSLSLSFVLWTTRVTCESHVMPAARV